MSAEPKFPSTETGPLEEKREAEQELKQEGPVEHVESPEKMSQDERENLCREKMVQLVVMGQEEVPIELRLRAADHIKKTPGTWRHFEPKVCDVVDDWIEDDVWHFIFKFTTDGPDNGWETEEKITLSKE